MKFAKIEGQQNKQIMYASNGMPTVARICRQASYETMMDVASVLTTSLPIDPQEILGFYCYLAIWKVQ